MKRDARRGARCNVGVHNACTQPGCGCECHKKKLIHYHRGGPFGLSPEARKTIQNAMRRINLPKP